MRVGSDDEDQVIKLEDISYPSMVTGGKPASQQNNRSALYRAGGYDLARIDHRGFEMLELYFSAK